MSAPKLALRLEIVAAVLVAGLCFAVVNAFRERVVVAGDTAPDFSITTESGRVITPKNFGGKLLVLNFWATWCPPCVQELPSLNAMAKTMASQGVVVVGVSVDKNQQAYRRFVERARISFETARDPEAHLSSDFGTYKFPETYIIGRDGRVIEKQISDRDWMDPEFLKRLASLL